jgi:hypothetical protein
MYYKGDEEESPGWRDDVEPVCYGMRKGVNYVRAWVGSGKSVSGEKENSKKPLPGWRFFREDRIGKWEVNATKNFTKEPGGVGKGRKFNPNGDGLMDGTIHCISNFSDSEKSNEPDGEPLKEESILSTIKEAINIF